MNTISYRTKDHPEANGQTPSVGDKAYTATFTTETGDRVVIEMGQEGFDAHTQMIMDMLTHAPSYDDGSLVTSRDLKTMPATAFNARASNEALGAAFQRGVTTGLVVAAVIAIIVSFSVIWLIKRAL